MFVLKLICLSLSIAVVCSQSISAKFKVNGIYQKCRAKFRLSKAEMDDFVAKGWYRPRSPKYKCMLACLMKETNVIHNGRLNVGKLIYVADKYYKSNKTEVSTATEIITDCSKKILANMDDCSFASAITICLMENSIRKGLKPVMPK